MAAINTGHGGTLTFTPNDSAPAWTASYISLSGFEQSRPVLDKSHLGTTDYREKVPGDLIEPGEFTAELFFDVDEQPPLTQGEEEYTVRITYPLSSSGTTVGGYVQGDAFISSWTTGDVATDALMTASITVVWEDGPTWTDET